MDLTGVEWQEQNSQWFAEQARAMQSRAALDAWNGLVNSETEEVNRRNAGEFLNREFEVAYWEFLTDQREPVDWIDKTLKYGKWIAGGVAGVSLATAAVLTVAPAAAAAITVGEVWAVMSGGSVAAARYGINLAKLRPTPTVAGKIAERPFINSPSTIRAIIESGKPVADKGLAGALRWGCGWLI